MATKFQIKRTSVSGRTPNTADPANSSYIAAGELAVNLTDKKVFSSNGTIAFEVGANLSTIIVSGNATINTVVANGSLGLAGQALLSNSSGGVYWGDAGGASEPTVITDTFTGNDTNTVFTLSTTTRSEKTFVFLNGVMQIPTTDYSVSNSTLTFVTAPANTDTITVRTFEIESLADVEFTTDTFTGNGSNTQYTLSTTFSSNTFSFVFLNGVAQIPGTDYGISGSTLTFTTAPPSAEAIRVTCINPIDEYAITTYTANGTTSVFGLPHPSSTKKTFVSINGLTQAPVTDYNVVGNSLTFTSPPASNDTVIIRSIFVVEDAAGANTTIQYNKSGDLGGSLGFTFNETTNNVTIGNTLIVPNFILNASNPPANSTASGATGTFAWDSSYFYIAVGTNTWKKVPITTDGAGGGGGSANTAGNNTEVQFNDSGVLGASAGFVFDKDSNNLTVANTLTITRLSANGTTGANKLLVANSTGGLFWSEGGGYGITRDEFAGNGTNTQFTLSAEPYSEQHVLVFVDGVIQRDADFSVSGTTLSFAVAPTGGAEIDTYVVQAGAAEPGGSNTHIQYNDSGVMGGSAAFIFNEATNTVTLSNTLAVGSNLTINTSAIFIGNSTVNTTIVAGNVDLQGTQLRVGNVVVNGNQLVLGNVTITDAAITVGNSTVNTVLGQSGNLAVTTITANGSIGSNGQLLASNGSVTYWTDPPASTNTDAHYTWTNNHTFQAAFTIANTLTVGNSTVNTYVNSTSVTATNINVGANVTINTSAIFIGNSTVNTVVNSSSISVKSLIANGSVGTSGQVLTSNGSTSYWANSAGGGGGESSKYSNQYLITGTTSDGVETEIFIDGGSTRVSVPANTVVYYTIDITCRRTDTPGDYGSWFIKGVAANENGTTSDIGSIYEVIVTRTDTNFAVDARANNTNDTIDLFVTGATGKTLSWKCVVTTVEV